MKNIFNYQIRNEVKQRDKIFSTRFVEFEGMSHAALVLALRQAILSLPDPKVALYFMNPTKALTPPTIKH